MHGTLIQDDRRWLILLEGKLFHNHIPPCCHFRFDAKNVTAPPQFNFGMAKPRGWTGHILVQPLARPSWPCNMSRRSPLILGTICRTDKDGRTDSRAEGRSFEDAMRIESEQLFFFVIVYQRPPSLNDAAAPAPIISYIILSLLPPRSSFPLFIPRSP